MAFTYTLKSLFSFFFTIVISVTAFSQDSITNAVVSTPVLSVKTGYPAGFHDYLNGTPDSLHYTYNKKAVRAVAITNVAGYSGVMAGLYAAWYKGYPQSKFHVFNDNSEWLQIDKFGHAYSAYAESRASMELWRLAGVSRKKRILLGGFSGAFYQTTIETLDGFSSQWGWSWGDIAANIFGSGLLVSQEFAWDEQRVQFKWSFHRKTYADPQLNQRSNKIFGYSDPERFLKDYNGQTYWMSANLRSFFPQSRIPSWLQISLGTGAEGLFGARSNVNTPQDGTTPFSRLDIPRYRQWYISPDIDLTKIKTKKKGVKMALNILSIIKVPAPSLEYSKKGFKVNWLSF